MKKLVILFLLSGYSISAFAEKNCTVNLKSRSYLSKVSNETILKIANQITSSTNVEMVKTDSDYTLEVYASETIDHHDARMIYAHGNTDIWPSHKIQRRSAVSAEFGTRFMKKKKLTQELLTEMLTKALKKQLKSCESIHAFIQNTGNGTLNPVDGNTYTTQVGAAFKRVGTYWKDPSGLLWGEVLDGKYANASMDSPAVNACKQLGARLPTADEYQKLLSYFSKNTSRGGSGHTLSDAGKYEFNALFPWSFGMYTTATRDTSGVGYDFHHIAGVSGQAMAHWELNVRCVIDPNTN